MVLGQEAHAAYLAEYLLWNDLISFLLERCHKVRYTPIDSRGKQCLFKFLLLGMYPALPFSYLESSLTDAVSPLLPCWAGHCLQMSSVPVGGSLGSQPCPSHLWRVGVESGGALSALPLGCFVLWHMFVKNLLEAAGL